MTTFGNTGHISLGVVSSVFQNADHPSGIDCYSAEVAYVSFSQWVSVILVYTLVYHMMEPPLEYYEIVEEEDQTSEIEEVPIVIQVLSRLLLVEAEWPGMEDKETEYWKTPFYCSTV